MRFIANSELRRRWTLAVFAAFSLALNHRAGLCTPAADLKFLVQVWTQDDGVPGNTVTGFAQGSDGYLWIASDQAIARFDGLRFVEASAEQLAPRPIEWEGPLRYVRRLFGASAQGVWLATGEGDLWRWTGSEFAPHFPSGTAPEGYLHVSELSPGTTLALTRSGAVLMGGPDCVRPLAHTGSDDKIAAGAVCQDPSGQVWFATASGCVGRVSPDRQFAWVATDHPARGLTADAMGRVWLADQTGLRQWRNGRFTAAAGPPDASITVRHILASSDGGLWVSAGEKAWRFADGCWRGPLGDWSDAVPAQARVVDRSGRLWLAAPRRGLRCLTPDGETIQLGPADGLTADATALFCDAEGDIWTSVYRIGIARVRQRRFVPVRLADGWHSTPVWNIASDTRGVLWFNAEFKGPVRWAPGAAPEAARATEGIDPAGWTKALALDRMGRASAAVTGAGIVCYDGDSFRAVAPWPAGAGFARVIYQDRQNRWWLGTDSGLHSWRAGAWTKWGVAEGLPSSPIRSVTEDAQGRLWIGTMGGGLARWDGKGFATLTRQHGLPDHSIYTLCAGADGSLWIGTHQGLARWQAGRLSTFTSKHGLPNDRVVQILEDGRGHLWAGTRDGLCRIAIPSFDRVARGERAFLDCLVFGKDDGLPTRVFQDRASPGCWRAADGELWFLTAGGPVHCRPAAIQNDPPPPPVRVELVLLDGAHYPAGSASGETQPPEAPAFASLDLRLPGQVVLAPGAHTLEIRYTSPTLAVPEKVAFEYMLEGLDHAWVSANGRRAAVYTLLPPGRYRFRVRARNHDGVWNEPKSALAVVVQPFLWQRAWFGPAVGGALACSGGAALAWMQRARLRRQMARLKLEHAQEADRRRISRDLHDHLGASLTEIGMLAEDCASGSAPAVEMRESCRAIKERVNAAVGDLDALVWAVDPKQDSVVSLARYLPAFVEEFASASGLECRVDVARGLPDCPLSSEARHHLLLATKEAVHNAVRHAKATELFFRLRVTGGALEVLVADNGRGFDPNASQSSGNGLANLRDRLIAVGGSCEVSSTFNAGAQVRMVCPLDA